MRPYLMTEITLSVVTTKRRINAESREEAQQAFDDGEWDAFEEEVGDCREVLSSELKEVK